MRNVMNTLLTGTVLFLSVMSSANADVLGPQSAEGQSRRPDMAFAKIKKVSPCKAQVWLMNGGHLGLPRPVNYADHRFVLRSIVIDVNEGSINRGVLAYSLEKGGRQGTFQDLPPGESVMLEYTAPPGRRVLTFVIDPENQLAEEREDNNRQNLEFVKGDGGI